MELNANDFMSRNINEPPCSSCAFYNSRLCLKGECKLDNEYFGYLNSDDCEYEDDLLTDNSLLYGI